MAWERRRNGRLYYYRAQRAGRRILKQYVGAGEAGCHAAAEDAAIRHQRAQAAQQQRQWQETVDGVTTLLDESEQLLKPMLTARLLCGGFRYRKREWKDPRCYKRK